LASGSSPFAERKATLDETKNNGAANRKDELRALAHLWANGQRLL
jgi:hypothetical protein